MFPTCESVPDTRSTTAVESALGHFRRSFREAVSQEPISQSENEPEDDVQHQHPYRHHWTDLQAEEARACHGHEGHHRQQPGKYAEDDPLDPSRGMRGQGGTGSEGQAPYQASNDEMICPRRALAETSKIGQETDDINFRHQVV